MERTGKSSAKLKSDAKRGAAQGGRGKSKSQNRKPPEKEENRVRREISGIVLIALGILFGLFCYPWGAERGSFIFDKIIPALFGVFGIGMYIMPMLLLALGIYLIASSKKPPHIGNISCAAVIVFSLLSLIHIIALWSDLKNFGGTEGAAFGKFISDGYKFGSLKSGGGFLGALTAYPLLKLADKAGAVVILIAVISVCIIVITRVSIRATINKLRGRTEGEREYRGKYREDDIGIKYVGDDEKTSPKNKNKEKGKEKAAEAEASSFMEHSGKPLTAGDGAYAPGTQTDGSFEHFERFERSKAKSKNNMKPKRHAEAELELFPASGALDSVSPGSSRQKRRKERELDWKQDIVAGLPAYETKKTVSDSFEIPINISNIPSDISPDTAPDTASGAASDVSFNKAAAEPVSIIETEEACRANETGVPTGEAGISATGAGEAGIPVTGAGEAGIPVTGAGEAEIPAANTIESGLRQPANENRIKGTTVFGTAENRIKTEIPKEVWEYQKPPLNLLKHPDPASLIATESPNEKARILLNTLESFHIQARITNISIGPVITRFELQPAQGIRVSKITTLSNDIALALAASRVRIEAPIPGKSAIGIEIPNKEVAPVLLREVLETREFNSAKSPLTFALGKDITGNVVLADLEKMPHMLIAGQTGSGKSVCINGIILSLVYKSSPKDVRMILIDPKVVELSVFASLPHLFCPVVTEPKKAAGALKWAVNEMEQRYLKMGKMNARDINRYNALQENEDEKWPRLVIIIDELADLMMVASKDVEESICRIAQLGRACGIHLIVATQRPSADIITGLIKANIPSRIAFAVSSLIDSRVILDMGGAERLLGKGDMLFHANGAHKPVRAQGAFVSDEEVEGVAGFFTEQTMGVPGYEKSVITEINMAGSSHGQGKGKQEDELLPDAVRIFIDSGTASISMLQRKLRVGYARAARLVDIMEKLKYISEPDGAKPRKVLIDAAGYAREFGENSGENSGEQNGYNDNEQF